MTQGPPRAFLRSDPVFELRKRGVEFVSAVYPGIFKVGPFPKFEVTVGRPQSRALGFRGEYSEYRIVTFKNKAGQTQQLWAKVDFELFRFARVRWRAERKESMPPALLPILEA